MESTARRFLQRHRMSWESLDLIREGDVFCREMEQGLLNKPSSLKMLLSYIDPTAWGSSQEDILVVDAGGTHFRRAMVHFTTRGPRIEHLTTLDMPGAKEPLDREAFFQDIAQKIAPYVEQFHPHRLGFCFSYPVEITPERDGRLIAFTKELQVRDAEGALLGRELTQRLPGSMHITVLNDATAALLGAVAVGREENRLHSVGLILGTGMNSSYVEANGNIAKDPSLRVMKGWTAVNLESGGYDKIQRGTADLRLDQKTANPGKQRMEKMMSGAYLGSLFQETVRLAEEEGHLPQGRLEKLLGTRPLTTRELTQFAQGSPDEEDPLHILDRNLSSDESEFLHALAKGLLRRAAKLAVINVLGIAMKIKKIRPDLSTVPLVLEGSTFYGSAHIQHYLDAYLNQIHLRTGIHIQRIQMEHSVLIGAASAALVE